MSIQSHVALEAPLPLELGVLGPFQVRTKGKWEAVGTRQVARLATMLAGWPGELIERERLAAGMWGGDAPATVANTLQAHVSQLRRVVGKQTVQCQGTSYRLDVPPNAVDAEHFAELVMEASRMRRRRHYARAAELLGAAKELWRGIPFPDVFDPDLQARRARLEEMREQALEDLLESRLEICRDSFDLAEVIADAKEMVSRHPLREKSHIVLVRALAAADRPGEAGAAFEEAAQNLRSTMGLDPGRALVDVHARGLNRDPQILPHAMRTISLVPNSPAEDAGLALTAQHVREAVTDLGARVVTVREADTERAEDLAAAIGEAIRLDAAHAVMVTQGAEISSQQISSELGQALGKADLDVTEYDKMGGVTLIVVDGGTALRKLLKSMRRWNAQPTVIAVGPETVGIDSEVLVDPVSQGEASSGHQHRPASVFRSRGRSISQLGA